MDESTEPLSNPSSPLAERLQAALINLREQAPQFAMVIGGFSKFIARMSDDDIRGALNHVRGVLDVIDPPVEPVELTPVDPQPVDEPVDNPIEPELQEVS